MSLLTDDIITVCGALTNYYHHYVQATTINFQQDYRATKYIGYTQYYFSNAFSIKHGLSQIGHMKI